jgi:hypothetical protein
MKYVVFIVWSEKSDAMKKIVSLLIIGASVISHLEGHVTLTYPEGGEIFTPGDTVIVTWEEDVPHNTLNWDLLFSVDGGSTWEIIASNLPLETDSYLWIVPETLTSMGEVKIVQDNENQDYIGTSGDFTISNATGITDPLSSEHMNVYPNPLIDYATIEVYNPLHNRYSLTLYNSQGKPVRTIQQMANGRVTVERKNLTAGLYFIRLSDGNEICAVGKLVVN